MKRFWFLLTIFYAIIHQKHLTITAVNTFEDKITDGISQVQIKLAKELSYMLTDAFVRINSPQFSLEEDDLPLEQNLQDELRDGNSMLYLHNVVIDGLLEIEDNNVETVYNERDVRIAVNMKQLVIHGEYNLERPAVSAEERLPFSVTLTNVRIEGIAYLLADGNWEVTKVVSSVWCEESRIWVKSAPAPCGQIMELALKYVRKNVEKRFARVAILEVNNMRCYNEYGIRRNPLERVLHEARRFVSQRYDPHTFRLMNEIMGEKTSTQSWQMSPLHFHGFSDFRLADIGMIVTNTSVDIMLEFSTTGDLYGNFSFFLQQECVGAFSIKQMNFIGKIRLTTDGSIAVPTMVGLSFEMNECRCRVSNMATGMRVRDSGYGLDVDATFCTIVQSAISTQSIMNTIQSEILNKVDLSDLKNTISEVVHKN